MLTEENYLDLIEALHLDMNYLGTLQDAYFDISQKVTPTVLDKKILDLLKDIRSEETKRRALLSRNQGRLKKASSIEWDTSMGSVTMDADRIVSELIMRLYNLLNLSKYGIPRFSYVKDNDICDFRTSRS
jgi:hypothetical protein